MIVQWTPDLAVGNSEIDNQHKELYRRIDSLLEAMESGQSRVKVDEVLIFLEKYVVQHFGTEERLMQMKSYPEAGTHIAQHREFMSTFGELKSAYRSAGPSLSLSIELQQLVCDWLRDHIGKTDKKLGAFISS